jgi:hypothetical protein
MIIIDGNDMVVGIEENITIDSNKITGNNSEYWNCLTLDIETEELVKVGMVYNNGEFSEIIPIQDLQEVKDAKCKVIDSQTQSDILNIASEPKQRNYLAKAIELEKKQRNGLTDEADDDQLIALESIWTSIETLVNDGNAKEQLVQDATNIEDIESI